MAVVEQIAEQAIIRRAQERLLLLGEMRDAHRLKQSGKSQRQIAEILRTTQPRVGRLLRGADELGKAPTPEEVILRATVDRTSRSALVKRLCALDYASDSWNQVHAAHLRGLLTDEEHEKVRARVLPRNTTTDTTR